jgi:hypothetical protein
MGTLSDCYGCSHINGPYHAIDRHLFSPGDGFAEYIAGYDL